jgi:hypothetical protein
LSQASDESGQPCETAIKGEVIVAVGDQALITNSHPLSISQPQLSIGRAEQFDLVPESGIASRLNFHPLIVGVLPGTDLFGQVIQNQVAFCRRRDKDEVADT